ncbi:MAG: hypothetical protein HYY25_04195 [Candidatus Wallbacteria bacterium]|nr:hypothetical protein [Candidatus Wallbacteria bacterium]
MSWEPQSTWRRPFTLALLAAGAFVLAMPQPVQSGVFDPVSSLKKPTAAKEDGSVRVESAARGVSAREACLRNQIMIADAVMRWSVMNNWRVESLSGRFFKQLVGEWYLARMPLDPGQGPGSSGNYFLTAEGISCVKHGAVHPGRLLSGRTLQRIRDNLCFRWQYNISTAVMRYNRANNLRVTQLDFTLFTKLVAGKFLSSIPGKPPFGGESYRNFFLTSSGLGVACKVHGPAPKP